MVAVGVGVIDGVAVAVGGLGVGVEDGVRVLVGIGVSVGSLVAVEVGTAVIG